MYVSARVVVSIGMYLDVYMYVSNLYICIYYICIYPHSLSFLLSLSLILNIDSQKGCPRTRSQIVRINSSMSILICMHI